MDDYSEKRDLSMIISGTNISSHQQASAMSDSCPWNVHRLQPEALGTGVRLMAEWHGDIAMEVAGKNKAAVIGIRKPAASRINREEQTSTRIAEGKT